MNLEKLKEKPIFQMTGEEFLYLQKNIEKSDVNPKNSTNENISKKYVYGIMGLAKLIDASKSTANRIKKSGIIDQAIIQNGRKIIIDSELALKLIKESN